MMRYALEVARSSVQTELDDETKQLNRMETDMRKLKNANERYKRDIERAEEAIRKAENNIVQNIPEQEDMVKRIEMQQKIIGSDPEKVK